MAWEFLGIATVAEISCAGGQPVTMHPASGIGRLIAAEDAQVDNALG